MLAVFKSNATHPAKRKKRSQNFDGFRKYFKGTHTVRSCMCCKKPFPSEGKHNRLCNYCRTLD